MDLERGRGKEPSHGKKKKRSEVGTEKTAQSGRSRTPPKQGADSGSRGVKIMPMSKKQEYQKGKRHKAITWISQTKKEVLIWNHGRDKIAERKRGLKYDFPKKKKRKKELHATSETCSEGGQPILRGAGLKD